MINLLPYEQKRQLKAARHNVILVKCLILFISAIIFLIINCTYTKSVINNGPDYEIGSDKENLLMMEQFSIIQATLGSISSFNNPKLADYLFDITNYLPKNVILNSITINQENVTTANLEIIAYGKTREDLQSLETELTKSPLISGVKIEEPKASGKQDYPYSSNVSIGLKAKKE